MAKKKTQQSSLLVSLGGAAIILSAYAAYLRLNPSPDAQRIIRLEEELRISEEGQIAVEKQLELAEDIRVKTVELDEVRARLDMVRRLAGNMMRGKLNMSDQLETGSKLNRILSSAGLRLIDEHPILPGNQFALVGSLKKAEKVLSETLTKYATEEAENTPIEIPEDLPITINPIRWLEEQRALRVGKFAGPESVSRDLKLVGNYHSMVSGLEAVIDTCPNVVVTSVAFQRPVARSSGPTFLIWNLRIQMRPEQNPGLSSQTVMGQQHNSSSLSSWSSDRGTKESGEKTHVVSKPVIYDSSNLIKESSN